MALRLHKRNYAIRNRTVNKKAGTSPLADYRRKSGRILADVTLLHWSFEMAAGRTVLAGKGGNQRAPPRSSTFIRSRDKRWRWLEALQRLWRLGTREGKPGRDARQVPVALVSP